MELDEKTILDLAEQLGISADKKSAISKIKAYEEKSDNELVDEILKLKNKLNDNNISFDKQMSAVESLMPMMNEEQKTRLYQIVELLKSK